MPSSTTRSASVPPAEAPIAISRSVVRNFNVDTALGAATALPAGRGAAGRSSARTLALAAALTLPMISSAYSSRPRATSSLGLEMKSTAPSASACSVVSAPRSVSEEIITTGVGRSRIRFSRNARPSMRGISTSRVITSGLSRLIFSRARIGSAAEPTTSMPGARDRISVNICRTTAESSTISTRQGISELIRTTPRRR